VASVASAWRPRRRCRSGRNSRVPGPRRGLGPGRPGPVAGDGPRDGHLRAGRADRTGAARRGRLCPPAGRRDRGGRVGAVRVPVAAYPGEPGKSGTRTRRDPAGCSCRAPWKSPATGTASAPGWLSQGQPGPGHMVMADARTLVPLVGHARL